MRETKNERDGKVRSVAVSNGGKDEGEKITVGAVEVRLQGEGEKKKRKRRSREGAKGVLEGDGRAGAAGRGIQVEGGVVGNKEVNMSKAGKAQVT